MPLRDELFSPAAVAHLGDLDCGATLSGIAAAEWIACKNPTNSALTSMSKGTQVWLYRDENGDLVGFCSLGPTGRTIKGVAPPIGMIPQFGLDARFHGAPQDADWEGRYSAQILSDILFKARELGYNGVFLLVHHSSAAAIKLYTRVGFSAYGQVRSDGYLPMFINLTGV